MPLPHGVGGGGAGGAAGVPAAVPRGPHPTRVGWWALGDGDRLRRASTHESPRPGGPRQRTLTLSR